MQIQSQGGFADPDLYLAVWATKAPIPVEPCHYENLRKSMLPPPFITHSQKATDVPFYAEAADDFVLTDPDDPDGDNACRLDQVQFAVWHSVPTTTPQNWSGVKITIYQDRGNVCGGQNQAFECSFNLQKGPGGYPIATPAGSDRQHGECCLNPAKAAVVCELKVPMSLVNFSPQTQLPGLWDITVLALDQYACNLEKNKKYWIAPAPVMDLVDAAGVPLGFTFLLTSPNSVDHEVQVISDQFFPVSAWQTLQSQIGWPETDLYLGVWATKAPSCPWDCVGNDGEIGIDEFLAVLGRWGVAPNNPCDFDGDGMIGINEFLKVLGLWGPCPKEP